MVSGVNGFVWKPNVVLGRQRWYAIVLLAELGEIFVSEVEVLRLWVGFGGVLTVKHD